MQLHGDGYFSLTGANVEINPPAVQEADGEEN
jgi:hypothetical protein